jgi:hypothetical protein
MTLLWADGFEQYTAGATDFLKAGYVVTGAATVANASDSRHGSGQYLKCQTSGTTTDCRCSTPAFAEASTIILGFAMLRDTVSESQSHILGFYSSGEAQLYVFVDCCGFLHVWRGTTEIAYTTKNIPLDTWCFVEFKIVFDNSVGQVTIRLNGAEVCATDANLDTQASATYTGCTTIMFGYDYLGSSYGTGANYIWYDDIYICNEDGSFNNDFLGDCQLHYLLPTADTADADWTCGTGSDHYALVNETIHNDDTSSDYLYTSTNGHKDIYTVGDLPSDIYKVRAVIAETWARLESAGDSTIKHVIVSGATESAGAGKGLTTSYASQRTIWETDPNEDPAAVWTPTTVNAAKIGVEAVIA